MEERVHDDRDEERPLDAPPAERGGREEALEGSIERLGRVVDELEEARAGVRREEDERESDQEERVEQPEREIEQAREQHDQTPMRRLFDDVLFADDFGGHARGHARHMPRGVRLARTAHSAGMDSNLKYDRDKLVDLLAERATFEEDAVELYDSLLESLDGLAEPALLEAREDLERHRAEEQEHAAWLEGLIHQLGGRPQKALPNAVHRESRALEQVIRTKPNGGGALPMFHAMLAAELMDTEGWKLLLEVAESVGDDDAVRELRTRVEREAEHLELVRRLMLTLAKESVEPRSASARTQPRTRVRRFNKLIARETARRRQSGERGASVHEGGGRRRRPRAFG